MRPVLLVTTSAAAGGAEQALARLARRLPDEDWAPTAVLLQEGPLEAAFAEAGCPVVVLPAGRARQLQRTVPIVARIALLARRTGAQALVSNMSKGHVYGGTAALAARLPAIWWQHTPPSPATVDRVAARVRAAAVAVVSEDCAAAQRRVTPRRPIVTIPAGAPVGEIAARRGAGSEVRAAEGWRDRQVIGVVGRLHPSKGHPVFLRAAARLAQERPSVEAAIVGGPAPGREKYEHELHSLAAALGLHDAVRFAGHQSDPIPWLDALDVVVLPAHVEGLPLVLVEAMALGKPVVASAVGGVPELIEDGRSGLLVRPGDADALAAAIARVLDDPALAARLGAAGRERAEDFSEERTAELFGSLLARVAP